MLNKFNPAYYLLLRALFMLTALFMLSVPSYAGEVEGPAPDFTLPSRDAGNLRLSEQRGQVVMINFWASWCGPCRKEMPLLNDLYQRYNKLGFTLLGVNIDEKPELAEKILKDIPVSFPVLFDSANSVSELYAVDAMPTTIIVDRDGNKRFLHRGYKDGYEKFYEQQIKELIKER